MSLLPRTIPATARQQLAEALTAAGVYLGDIKPFSRVTLLAEHAGTCWEITYIGHGDLWRVVGPGREWGPGATTNEVADYITAPAPEPEPEPAAPEIPLPKATAHVPRTYAGVPVPALVRENWRSPLADGWRLGVRSADSAS
ncbi:hypothetical protein [Streptomyces halobius]|uniref:Uncharacterized protein n=1 Tax=Streptomyces halobius TaxID=2879846 RepID=A0ABY4MEW5_9ACTN|nr:hypothetical protein [Streptomyces halobius]UQA95653.1 hypothetical protein K9S39_30695 [Streptomyces halobius]